MRKWCRHKVLTYVEYRVVSGVFQNTVLAPTPFPPSECVLPLTKGWGVLHCKKRIAAFPSPAGMSLTKLSLARNNLIHTGQGEFGK
jgi:hypothetical protein